MMHGTEGWTSVLRESSVLKERPYQTVKVNSNDFSELSIPSSAKVKYLVQDGSQELYISVKVGQEDRNLLKPSLLQE